MIALFLLGLAAVAVGPALALLADRPASKAPASTTAAAGMFVAINDNTKASRRRAA